MRLSEPRSGKFLSLHLGMRCNGRPRAVATRLSKIILAR
jgi:hypothetical protein